MKKLEKLLDTMYQFHGKRSTPEKEAADKKCFDYLNENFKEVMVAKSALNRIWPVLQTRRYTVLESEVPAGTTGNLKDFAGKKIWLVFASKDRNGRMTAYIKVK